MIAGDDLVLFERSLRHATERGTGESLDAALEELGWPDALVADPRAAISLLFAAQGAANATSSALDRVLATALGLEGGIVWPALGGCSPPGELRDGRLAIAGLGPASLAGRDRVVVVARAGPDHVSVIVPTSALTMRRVSGIDPGLGLLEVTADTAGDLPIPQPAMGWDAAVAGAQLALGYELLGASRTMLALAREHALQRVQFGRPISMFQAVRHRLADTVVAIEMAEAALDAAWADPSPLAPGIGKAIAGRSARTTARHCQQVLAGIGFTTDHPLHRYLRRTLVLDQLLGAARSLTTALGHDILAQGALPKPLPL